MKMAELVEKYLSLRVERQGGQTYMNTASLLRRFAREWDRTRKVPGSLDAEWVHEFLVDVRAGNAGGKGRPLQASSYNKAQQQLGRFLKYASTRQSVSPFVLDALGRLPVDPKDYVRVPLATVWQAIETCEDPWERWVLALSSQTLGRVSELRSRNVRHIHLDTQVVDWYRPKTRTKPLARVELFLTEDLADEWRRWSVVYAEHCGNLQPEWPLIPYRNYIHDGSWLYKPQPISTQTLSGVIQKNIARALGWDRVALKGQAGHIMRRSIARALYDRLVEQEVPNPIRKVMTALGHSQQSTTEQYIGIHADVLETNALLSGSNLLGVDRDNIITFPSKEAGNG